VQQTQITPTILNKVLKVNTSSFCYEHLALRVQKASHWIDVREGFEK